MNRPGQRGWVLLLIWLLVGSAFSSCNSPDQESHSQEKTAAAVAETPKEAPVKAYPLEQYGDPEIFSTPRLQFSWKAPGDKEKSLWSIKLDGSDLRRVLPYDLLYKEGILYNYTPLRSPNNRYIYIAQDHSGDWPRRNLIDLKNQTVTVLAEGGIVPYGTWSTDSKSLFFYCDVNFYNYNVKNKKLTNHKWIASQGIQLLPDGKFFALHEKGYSIYKPNGEKEEFVELGKNILTWYALNDDGTLLFYRDGKRSIVIETDNPKVPIYDKEFRILYGAFGPDKKSFYYIHNGFEIRKLFFYEKKSEIVYKSTEGKYGITRLTLVNG